MFIFWHLRTQLFSKQLRIKFLCRQDTLRSMLCVPFVPTETRALTLTKTSSNKDILLWCRHWPLWTYIFFTNANMHTMYWKWMYDETCLQPRLTYHWCCLSIESIVDQAGGDADCICSFIRVELCPKSHMLGTVLKFRTRQCRTLILWCTNFHFCIRNDRVEHEIN